MTSRQRQSMNRILRDVCTYTGMESRYVTGNSRKERYVDARQAFCILAYYKGNTYESIGEFLNRDHSSIIHLCNYKPMNADVVAIVKSIKDFGEDNRLLQSMENKLMNNPEDEELREKLKQLI